jgi:ABC-type Fe3+ transport system permease subunit
VLYCLSVFHNLRWALDGVNDLLPAAGGQVNGKQIFWTVKWSARPHCGSRSKDAARKPDTPLSPHRRFWGTFFWSVLILIVAGLTQMLVAIIDIALSNRGKYTGSDFAAQLQSLQSATHNGDITAHTAITSTIVCRGLIAGVIKLKN